MSSAPGMQVFVGETGFKPTRGSVDSAGWDLYASEDVPRIGTRVVVSTDVYVAIPRGFYGRIAPRSGLAVRNGINVLAGVVDCDYRGEVKVVLHNIDGHAAKFQIKRGDRIAQLIVTKYNDGDMEVVESVDQLGNTNRGDGGFGSTGVALNTETDNVARVDATEPPVVEAVEAAAAVEAAEPPVVEASSDDPTKLIVKN